MKLIGDGVVESILKGENIGITPRRRNVRNSLDPRYCTPRIRNNSPHLRTPSRSKQRKTDTPPTQDKDKVVTEKAVQKKEKEKSQPPQRKRKTDEETPEQAKPAVVKKVKTKSPTPQKPSGVEVAKYDQAQISLLCNNQPTVVVKPLRDSASRYIQEDKKGQDSSKGQDSKNKRPQKAIRGSRTSPVAANKSRTSSPIAALSPPVTVGRGRTSSPRGSRHSSPAVGRGSRTASPVTSPVRASRNASPASSRSSSSPVAASKPKPEKELPKRRSETRRNAPKPAGKQLRSRTDSPAAKTAAKTSPRASQLPTAASQEELSGLPSPRGRSRNNTPTAVRDNKPGESKSGDKLTSGDTATETASGTTETSDKSGEPSSSVKSETEGTTCSSDGAGASSSQVKLASRDNEEGGSVKPPSPQSLANSKAASPSPSPSHSQVRNSPSLLAGPKHKDEDSNKMHHKKMHLLDSLQKKAENSSTHESFTSESGINVNHSLTDQIAKLSSVKSEKGTWNNNDLSISSQDSGYNGSDKDIVSPRHNFSHTGDYRQNHKNMDSSGEQESRSSSRTSQDERRPSSSSSSSHTPRADGRAELASSSPLVVDRRETVHVWRDPELLKQDELRLYQQQQAVAAALQQGRPVQPPHCSTYPGIPASLPLLANPQTLLYRPTLPSLMSQAGPALTTSLLGAYTHPLLPSTQGQVIPPSFASLHSNLQTAQLELLWQHKYPTVPVPPPWMLNQYQDELLRDVNILALEREKILERERIERERLQRERVERERVERAERERAERERAERERAERERKEREKAEQERLERERKEREEKERRRREEHERERVLKESVSAQAAVDQHFHESLRIANQKKSLAQTSWMSAPPRSYPKPLNLSTERSPPSSARGMSAFTPHRPESDLRKQEDKDTHGATDLRTTDDKRQLTLHQEHVLRQQFLKEHEALHGRPPAASPPQVDSKYPVGYPMVASQPPSQPVKQEPSFNLYGYQPQHHTFITQDKLRSIKDEKRPKEPHSSPPLARPAPQRPDINKSSVIKENKVPVMPAAAHTGSIVQGTSRTKDYPAPPMAHSGLPQMLPRTQSPLRVASPQQLSAAVMQPMELHKSKPYPEHMKVGSATSVVQQTPAPSQVKVPVTSVQAPRVMVPEHRDTQSPIHPGKRRSPLLDTQGKKPKLEMLSPNSNPSPSQGLMGGAPVGLNNSGSFMDSFRSFVENTVQSAFFQDQESNKQQAKTWRPPSTTAPATQTVSAVATQSGPVVTQATHPALSTTPQPMMLSGVHRPTPTNTPGGASVSSTCSSITDTINRVANGFDTDSDTLSAPSPPPHIKSSDSNASPCSKVNHTKFKKAWLQRYSDDNKDKKEAKPAGQTQPGQPQTEKNVKECYVNCSYISPTKEGGRKSPIASIKKDSAGTPCSMTSKEEDMEATSSASETESQGKEKEGPKKKPKNKRQRGQKEETGKESPATGSKKSKISQQDKDQEDTPAPPAKKRLTRKKEPKEKKTGQNIEESILERKEEEEKSKAVQRAKEANPPPKPTSDSEVKMERKQRARKNVKEEPVKDTKVPKKEDKKPIKSEKKDKKEQEEKEEKMKEKKDAENESSDTEDEDPARSTSPSQALASKPLNKESVSRLKKTMVPFLQDASCSECTPKLSKCRECKMTPNQRNKKQANIFCRFYAFRRLKYNQKQALTIAGFSEPSDAEADEIELWMPRTPVMPPRIDVQMAKYLVTNVGDQFCELVEQEKEAMSWVSPDTQVAWKRAVQGVREMCDVCYTTLFNMHWVCHRCGFVVCIDCYRQRTKKSGGCKDHRCTTCETEGQKWLTCSVNRQQHEPEKLMLTQIIPSDALWVVGRVIHEVREKWRIRANCPCGQSKMDSLLHPKNGVTQIINSISEEKKQMNGVGEEVYKHLSNGNQVGNISPLTLLADVASLDSENKLPSKKPSLVKMQEALQEKLGNTGLEEGEDDHKNTANCSTLRELLTKTAGKPKMGSPDSKKGKPMHSTLDDIIQQVVERNVAKDGEPTNLTLKHYIPRSGSSMQGRDSPVPCYTLSETSVMFPDVPHSWLDNGRLLRLHDPHHKGNLKLFQQQWRRAQPVLVSGVHKLLNKQLWLPATFSKEFGTLENDLVNCRTGVVIIGHEMGEFWEGFESMTKRLKDERGRPMILKLKDWPPTEDFNDLQPKRFEDLMAALPMPEYTHRTGVCNLASRLPDFFVKPDLGPKMYNAYGSALYPKEGTTNLHLDVSDAVNVMVYVGIPYDDIYDHKEAALEAIDKVGCCMLTRQRVREQEEKPGAIWHIFDPHDADKIRDLLNKVAKERGEEIEPHHDPIHDQSWYLDENLRQRLKEEYNVVGYSIIQCLGDAVYVPAGAPHQVRNLHSCIKIAEDFVSPENLRFCFKLTQEFRHLSDTHSNHEDKLQVKNIIYHVVKDAVAVLKDADP